ncbi:MAG: M28 family metallopeptidase [Bacteroidia bacterium]
MSAYFRRGSSSFSSHHFTTSLLLVALFHFTFSISCFSQESSKSEVYKFGRKVVDTLTSPAMHGRGYVNGGDSIAAAFIKSVFQRTGVKAFENRYYQKVTFPVNVIDDVDLYVDGKALYPGKDYLPNAGAPARSGKAEVVYVDEALLDKKKLKKFMKLKLDDKILVISDTGKQDPQFRLLPKAKMTVWLKDKLTWDVSQQQLPDVEFDVLRSAMPSIPKEMSFSVRSHLIPNHKTQNVIGYIPGYDYKDSFIVFTAHYDHLGQLGKSVYFPGANDNASGCAMLLNLAKYYNKLENRPKYTIVFIAFCGEEAGLLGSKYFVNDPVFPLKNIKFLLNMDIMGTGEDGITVVNGSVYKKEFDKLKELNTVLPDSTSKSTVPYDLLKDVKIRGKAANSDHYMFSEKGVKAFFIYTMGGIKAYHDIYDKSETLPLNEFDDLFRLITRFCDYLQFGK